MISRHLEKKITLSTNEDLPESKNPFELEYYLLESECSEVDELTGKKVYGIEIIKRMNDLNTEKEVIKNVSCCRENTQMLLSKLAQHTVTPVGLPFILDDLLGV